MLGEFPVVTNWTFKTTFHPRYPAHIATASYDGKIAVRTLQNTNPQVDDAGVTATDGDDFFSRASNAQTSSFSLKQTPMWLKRPVGATFGFGGKLVSFSSAAPNQSKVKISTVPIDSGVNAAMERFEKTIQQGNLAAVCDEKAQDAKSEDEKSEWQILKALFHQDTKAKLVEYLGFKAEDIATPDPEKEEEGEGGEGDGQAKGEKRDRLSAFFGDGDDSENFLASLSIRSTQTARTNNPFRIYTGDETKADKAITKAVVLGEYERAVDVCLKEDRITDAFMLAICGGDPCIDKVKAAYFTKKSNGPNYLRLLASVVGKNLWDVVHNADLANWREVVGALCTHASDSEFPDLIEALGDRLEEEYRSKNESGLRQAALLCYLGGSKLHKVVGIWIGELHEAEKADLQEESEDSTFSVHARSLQNFIEKVSVFREAVKFVDNEKALSSGWKLNALYEKYCEYADVVASHGQLSVAGKYLDLLPSEYPAAQAARNRVKQASTEAPAAAQVRKPQQPATTGFRTQQPFQPAQQPTPPGPYQPAAPYNPQGSAVPVPAPYQQLGGGGGGGGYRPTTTYQPAHPAQSTQPIAGPYAPQYAGASGYTPTNMGQPPRFAPPTPAAPPPPPPKGSMTNWNDTPEVVRPPRKATPAQLPPQPSASPFPGAPPVQSPPQPSMPWGAPPPKATPPPPPKGLPPQRVQSPAGQFRSNSPAIAGPGYQQAAPPPPQSQYAAPPPPPPSGRYTPQPTQNPAGGPPGARPSIPLLPPQGAVIPGRTSSGPQYAPPPSAYATGPSPYAPQQPQQPPQGPYAPPHGAPPHSAPPPPQGPYATPQGAPPPQGNYAPPPPGSQGPPPARPPPAGQHATAPPSKPATPAPPPSKHRE